MLGLCISMICLWLFGVGVQRREVEYKQPERVEENRCHVKKVIMILFDLCVFVDTHQSANLCTPQIEKRRIKTHTAESIKRPAPKHQSIRTPQNLPTSVPGPRPMRRIISVKVNQSNKKNEKKVKTEN